MRARIAALSVACALAAGLALVVAGACARDQGVVTLDELDPDSYARDIQPIFEARCGTLDCHGVAGRPLRLYAETGLRARDDLRDLPMTNDELLANVRAVEAIDPGSAFDEGMMLRKPLAEAAGGVAHEGGDVWQERDEPQASCVIAWLRGESDDPAAQEACLAAAAEVALPAP
jgi:hypothetical protein